MKYNILLSLWFSVLVLLFLQTFNDPNKMILPQYIQIIDAYYIFSMLFCVLQRWINTLLKI